MKFSRSTTLDKPRKQAQLSFGKGRASAHITLRNIRRLGLAMTSKVPSKPASMEDYVKKLFQKMGLIDG